MMGMGMDMGEGVKRIGRERRRQIEEKGWTEEHDRTEHMDGTLRYAVAAPLLESVHLPEEIAGALIAAEIDRLTWVATEND